MTGPARASAPQRSEPRASVRLEAAASAAADAAGYKVRGEGGFDDGATPPRIYFPYKN